jgi:hypothetical protein
LPPKIVAGGELWVGTCPRPRVVRGSLSARKAGQCGTSHAPRSKNRYKPVALLLQNCAAIGAEKKQFPSSTFEMILSNRIGEHVPLNKHWTVLTM